MTASWSRHGVRSTVFSECQPQSCSQKVKSAKGSITSKLDETGRDTERLVDKHDARERRLGATDHHEGLPAKFSARDIHHYFPAKSDLARAVVQQSRDGIEEQLRQLTTKDFDPYEQLLFYTSYWERCILDATAPFCVAGMLAAEMPTLPQDLAQAVREHFESLSNWLETVLTKGSQLGKLQLNYSARREAEAFMSSVYGAMLIARAYGNTRMFPEIVELSLRQLLSVSQSNEGNAATSNREAKSKRVVKK